MAQTYKLGVAVSANGASAAYADLARVDAKLNSFGQTARASLASLSGNLASDAIQQLSQYAITGGQAIFQYSENVKSAKISLESLTGSAVKAQSLFRELEAFARSTPFSELDFLPLAQRLLGANVELRKTVPLLRDVGNLVAGTGKATSERLEGITVALTQVIGKQKLSAEEAEQFAERGVNAYDIVAKATGKTQAEVRKLGEEGSISADLFVASLQKISRERFGDAMVKQGELASVALQKIKSEVVKAAAETAEPLLAQVAKFASKIRQEITAQKGDLTQIGNLLAKYLGEGMGSATRNIAAEFGKQLGKDLRG